jgi:mRNA interferase RelE/StbE
MAWKVEISRLAQKQLDDLDVTVSRRIVKFLRQRVEKQDDPRQIGDPLEGPLRGYWRYRVGDYRVVCLLEHDRLVVLVLRVGHRREIYNR